MSVRSMRDSSTSSPMAMPSLSNTSLGRNKAAASPTVVIRSRAIILPLSGLIVREPCEKARAFWKPNATPHPHWGAVQAHTYHKRTALPGVGCRRMLGQSEEDPRPAPPGALHLQPAQYQE